MFLAGPNSEERGQATLAGWGIVQREGKMAAGQRDAHVAQGYLPVTSHKAEGYARPTFSSSLYFFSSTFLAITAQ